jgi:hypothetical protein
MTPCRRFIPEAAELRPNAGYLSGHKAWTAPPDKIDLIWEYFRLHLGLVGGCFSLKGVFK